MLNRILIQNFALIDSLEISLGKGLQVITGETGAGKSIILGALRLILGERADVKAVNDSQQKSLVEAEFLISEKFKYFFEENDLDFETSTIIRRELLPSGKSRAFINDVPVTLEVLKELSSSLIDIHSQFETSNLFTESYQFEIIDGLSKDKSLIVNFQKEFAGFKKLRLNLEKLKIQLEQGNKESDYKNFLLNELNDAALHTFNFEELQNQLNTQQNAGAITDHLSLIFSRLDAEEIGILDALNDVRSKLAKIGDLSHEFSAITQRFEENFVEFKDIVFDLQNEAEQIEINPEAILQLQEKIDSVNALMLKHSVNSVEELIEVRDELSGEQLGFEELQDFITKHEAEISASRDRLEKLSKKLFDNRKKNIPKFTAKIESLLKNLGLEKSKIEVKLQQAEDYNNFGREKIEILFQANSGFPLKPIQSAISGGERSRVMLAVKKIMAENAALPTLILDEIDTGVSGKIAAEMGKVMHEMSENMQLIVITHLAQVAAKGDSNYKVLKEEIAGKTRSTIIPLNREEKHQEIAQLLSGSKITDAALQQAAELMK